MEKTADRREHYNLYYIFEADRQRHEMPKNEVERIRKNIFKKFSENLKPFDDENPP